MKILIIITALLECLTVLPQNVSIDIGATYAVVVGISDYQDEDIPDLKYAHRDAEAFASYLRSPAGGSLDDDDLKLLINKQATVAQFAIALDWLCEVSKENDRVIIYFSGHGDVEKKMLTQPGYLLCWDAPSHVYMAGGAFNVRDLKDVISTLSIQNNAKVILITDACRSGKLSGSSVRGAQATAANLAKQFSNEIKILSCQPDEYSVEGEQWGGGRGAFNFHLLEGLYGMADRNNDDVVSLMEIRSYLEEHVSMEVAPQDQLPMVVGSSREKISNVWTETLEQLKEGKKSQIQYFIRTDSRGIEEDVLESVDSSIMKMYYSFKQSLKDKEFLFPKEGCADTYYMKLIKEPSLKRMHSTMRRNYAAALQDDAQQELNSMLKTGLTKEILTGNTVVTLYKDYPAYLERAAELLGKEHYMYSRLQARKYFFKGKMQKTTKEKRKALFKALKWQPDMPHTLLELGSSYEENQDSATYYMEKVIDQVPSWVAPYILLAKHHLFKRTNKTKILLEQASQIDSNSLALWYFKGNYHIYNNYDILYAEQCYLNVISKMPPDVSFPIVHFALGNVYLLANRLIEAEKQFLKCLELNPTFYICYDVLGDIYYKTQQYNEAERIYKRAVSLAHSQSNKKLNRYYLAKLCNGIGSNIINFLDSPEFNLWEFYIKTNRQLEVDIQFSKILENNINNPLLHFRIGEIYYLQGQYAKSDIHFQNYLELKDHWKAPQFLSWFYLYHGEFEKAKQYIEQIISVQKVKESNFFNGHYDLAWLYFSFGKKKEAVQLLNEFVDEQGITDLEVVGHRIMFSAFIEAPEKSKANFEAYIPINPKIMDVWECLELMKTNQYDQAKAAYLLITNDIIEWWIKRYLRLAYVEMKVRQGNYQEAIEIMDRCKMDHYTYNYPLLTTDTAFAPLWELDAFNSLLQKYFPEKVND